MKDAGYTYIGAGTAGAISRQREPDAHPLWWLSIERSIVWKVDRSAIAAQTNHSSRRRVLVEHNIARNGSRCAGSYNAGIRPPSTAKDSIPT